MHGTQSIKPYVFLWICLNISLQIIAFCLMKFSWIHAQHSFFNLINIITMSAFGVTFLRAFVWQHILKVNDLAPSYLSNAIVPSLLLFAGHFIFKEHITFFNILGSLIILIGLILLTKNTVKQ